MIRVILPWHLRTLARVEGEVLVDAGGEPTIAGVLDALEAAYPVLQGTIRHHVTRKRRPFIRFYACADDYSNEPADTPLPASVVAATEPFLVVGAMAGG